MFSELEEDPIINKGLNSNQLILHTSLEGHIEWISH